MQIYDNLRLKEAAYQSNRLMQRLLKKEIPFEEIKSFFQNFLKNNLDSKLLSLHSRASIGLLFSQCLREFAPMIPLDFQSYLDKMIYIMSSALICLGEPTSIDYNSALSIIENLLQTNSFYLFSSETAIFTLEVLSNIETQESITFMVQLLENIEIQYDDFINIEYSITREPFLTAIKLCSRKVQNTIINTSRTLNPKLYKFISSNMGIVEEINDLYDENPTVRMRFIKKSLSFFDNEKLFPIIETILSRHIDNNSEVRLLVLSIAEIAIKRDIEPLLFSSFDSLSERITDNDERVRMKSLEIISKYKNVPFHLMKKGAQRIADKNKSIQYLAAKLTFKMVTSLFDKMNQLDEEKTNENSAENDEVSFLNLKTRNFFEKDEIRNVTFHSSEKSFNEERIHSKSEVENVTFHISEKSFNKEKVNSRNEVENVTFHSSEKSFNEERIHSKSEVENVTFHNFILRNGEIDGLIRYLMNLLIDNSCENKMIQKLICELYSKTGLKFIVSHCNSSPQKIFISLSNTTLHGRDILTCGNTKLVKLLIPKYRNSLVKIVEEMISQKIITDELLTVLNHINLSDKMSNFLSKMSEKGIFVKSMAKVKNIKFDKFNLNDLLKFAVLTNNVQICEEIQIDPNLQMSKWKIRSLFLTNKLRSVKPKSDKIFIESVIKSLVDDQFYLVNCSLLDPEYSNEVFFSVCKKPKCPTTVLISYSLFVSTHEGNEYISSFSSIISLRKKFGIFVDFDKNYHNEFINGVNVKTARNIFK